MGREEARQTPAQGEPRNPNGCSVAKETTMKRFLKSLTAVLKKRHEAKSVEASKRPSPTLVLEVRTQVKAGSLVSSYQMGGNG
jgi:hypothetical protein